MSTSASEDREAGDGITPGDGLAAAWCPSSEELGPHVREKFWSDDPWDENLAYGARRLWAQKDEADRWHVWFLTTYFHLDVEAAEVLTELTPWATQMTNLTKWSRWRGKSKQRGFQLQLNEPNRP